MRNENIRQTTLIASICANLSDSELDTLKGLLSSNESETIKSFTDSNFAFKSLSNNQSEIRAISIEGLYGICVRKKTSSGLHEHFIHYYADKSVVDIYKLDTEYQFIHLLKKGISTIDLRFEVAKFASGVENAWVEVMKDKMIFDSEDNEIQVGVHLYADGDFESGGDIVCGRDIIIDNLANLQNTDGVSFLPDSEPNKVPVGGSDFVYHLKTPAEFISAPATGHYKLESVNGVLTWVEVE